MTTGGLPGHLTGTAHSVYPASVVSRAPAHGATKFSSASRRFGKLCSSLHRMNSWKMASQQSIQSVCHSVNIYQSVNKSLRSQLSHLFLH